MTTTDHFQKYPDYYFSEEECKKGEYQRTNWNNKNYSNPRYKLRHTHFTAGDESQFQEYRDMSNGTTQQVNLENNIYKDIILYNHIWDKYRNLDCNSIENTFRYMFNKFKKGIFIKIKDGKLKVFLPFSKQHYRNEWSNKINMNNREILTLYEKLSHQQGYKFNPKKINLFI